MNKQGMKQHMARELKLRLMRWNEDRTDLYRRFQEIGRLFRQTWPDQARDISAGAGLSDQVNALNDALDEILDQ